jgi:hypothetical protein
MMRDDYPQTLLHDQALRTNCAAGLSIGTELVSSLMHESKGETLTGTAKGERDATEHQNKDRGREEPHPLGGDTVSVFSLVLVRSTATAGPRDHQA